MEVAIDWKILIGQIVNFAILFFILKKFVYGPVLNLLENRRKKIEEGINKSLEAEDNLRKIAELKKKMEGENEDAKKAVLLQAAEEAKKRAENSLKVTEEERQKLLAKASKEAEEIKLKEKENTEKEIVENAFVLAEKILKDNIDEGKNKKITEEFLKKLNV